MPLLEDAPKKKFKPKRRNSWDLASILNEKTQDTSDEISITADATAQIKPEVSHGVVPSPEARLTTKPTEKSETPSSQIEDPKITPSENLKVKASDSLKSQTQRKQSFAGAVTSSLVKVYEPRIETGAEPDYLGSAPVVEPDYSGSAPVAEPNYSGSDTGAEKGSATGSRMASTGRVKHQKSLSILDVKIPLGELAVLRVLADLEIKTGELIYVNRGMLATMSAQTIDGVKTALRRLREKKLIELGEFKRGATKGWTSYLILEPGREVLSSTAEALRVNMNWAPNRVPQRVQKRVQNRVLSSSSSSLDLLDTTTTDRAQNFERNSANDPSVGIDCSPLADIGFKTSHARQALREGLITADQLQESIHHFAFDLHYNNKEKQLKGPAINYFMGIIRKGPYAPPPNFESAEEIQLRVYLEGKEQQLKRRRETEDRIRTVQCEEWIESLSFEDKLRLAPPTEFSRVGSPGHSATLQEYFAQVVWPELRKDLLRPSS
jgi:hypothetical protein